MKFNLENPQVALTHVVLADSELAVKLSKTDLWLSDGILEATLFINGIEIPAKLIEDVMQDLYARCEKDISAKYKVAEIDTMVEEKAQLLIKQHADDCLSKIFKLSEILENSGDLLKPYWERK